VFGDFKLLLLLAMKPGCGQQLSRRVGNHRSHITHPTSEIRTTLTEAYNKNIAEAEEKTGYIKRKNIQQIITTW
jgi:hypothetical protein